ncbi:MAG: DUF2341 domain-containing protein [Burkholderiales bacterium]
MTYAERTRAVKRSLTNKSNRLTLEELEPRQLLSADFVPLPVEPAPLAKSAVQEAITSVFAAQPTDPAALLSSSYELVFVDPRVPDSAQLLADFAAQNADGSRRFEIITLDPSRDGIVQVTEALADRMQVDAVHFITHGSDAAVQLGGSVLNAKALAANAEAVASWGHALKHNADLLFYGCDLASSASGRALMDWIAELTQADVAASTDKTGAAEQSGNWTLEYQHGQIDAEVALSAEKRATWDHTLAPYSIPFAGGTVTIDGNGAEAGWASAAANAITTQVLGSTISGPADLSGAWKALWDSTNIYVLVAVSDNQRWNDSGGGVNFWADDSVEIYIDATNNSKALSTYDGNDAQFWFLVDGTIGIGPGSSLSTAGITRAVVDSGAGYVVETAIPWTTLGYASAPSAGQLIGIDVMIQDDDDGGTRDDKLSWNSPNDLAWQNPSLFGTGVLAAPINTAPTITSDGGGASASVNAAENQTAVTTVSATDPDVPTTLTYSIAGGADAARFAIDGTTGVLTFLVAPDFETPTDAGANNVYDVFVRASDGALFDDQAIAVSVTNVNEAPVAADDSCTVVEDGTLTVGWWNSDWTRRSQITFDNTNVGGFAPAETLMDFPVLVVLNASNIDYAFTQDDGGDLRFFDSDGTPLAYEIERWDETGNSYVWVRVPQIDIGAADSILMYYGNAGAADGQDASAAWAGTGYRSVYHLSDSGAVTGDATATSYGGTPVNGASSAQPGQIGLAYGFDGVNDYIDLGANRSFIDGATAATFSAWVNPDDVTNPNIILSASVAGAPSSTSRMAIELDSGGVIKFIIRSDDGIDTTVFTTTGVTAGAWHYVTGVVDLATDEVTAYIDGTARALTGAINLPASAFPNTPSATSAIGANDDGTGPYFDGRIDEARIATVARSAGWIQAEYRAMLNQAGTQFVSVGAAQSAPALGGVLDNDTDAEGAALSAALVSGPANGSVTFLPNGTFVYTPDPDFNGIDNFQYRANDGTVDSNVATVTITVTPVNDPPLITSDGGGASASVNAAENQTAVTTVSATDPDVPTTLTYSISGGADQGLFSIVAGTGVLTFNAAPDFETFTDANSDGVYEVEVTVSDGLGGTDLQLMSVTVTDANDDPTALDDSGAAFTTNEDSAFTTGNVLANDTDLDIGDVLAVSVLDTTVALGLVTDNGDGTFNYNPNGAFNYLAVGESTTDTFSYTVSDGNGGTATATVTLTITGTDDLPVAVADTDTIAEDAVSVAGNVRTNDTLGDGTAALNVTTLNGSATGSYGTIALGADGSYTYTLDNTNPAVQQLAPGDTLTETFNYTLTDKDSDTSSANLVITITGVNDAAVLTTSGGTLAYTENGTFTSVDPAVTVADIDNPTLASATVQITGGYVPGEDLLTFTSAGGITGVWDSASGTLTLTGPATVATWQSVLQSVAYQNTSDNPSAAPRTATLIVNDGTANSAPAFRTINVTPVNDAPSITTNSLALNDGATVTLSLANLGSADPDNVLGGLAYTVFGIVNGQFELTSAPGTAVTTFTQADVAAGLVVFVHAGNNLAPAYTIHVSDGALLSAPSAAVVAFTPNGGPGITAPVGGGGSGGSVTPPSEPPTTTSTPTIGGDDTTPLDVPASVSRGGGEEAPIEAPVPAPIAPVRVAAAELEKPVVEPEAMVLQSSTPTFTPTTQVFAPEFAQTQRAEITVELGTISLPEPDGDRLIKLDLDSIRMTSLALSVGAIWWATRATGLIASLLSSLPAWRNFDPLPVLGRDEFHGEDDLGDTDEEQESDEEAEEEALVSQRFSNEESQPIELDELKRARKH